MYRSLILRLFSNILFETYGTGGRPFHLCHIRLVVVILYLISHHQVDWKEAREKKEKRARRSFASFSLSIIKHLLPCVFSLNSRYVVLQSNRPAASHSALQNLQYTSHLHSACAFLILPIPISSARSSFILSRIQENLVLKVANPEAFSVQSTSSCFTVSSLHFFFVSVGGR
jgi:hypothetical protein